MFDSRFARLWWAPLVAVVAGCGAAPSTIVPFEGDHGVAAIQFADIPVPDGMHLKTHSHESHSYEVGAFRYGDFEYFGPVRVGTALSYMRERMAVHGWQLAKDEFNEGANELVFWRRPYRAECRIWKDNSRTRMRVELRTEILSQGEASPEPVLAPEGS